MTCKWKVFCKQGDSCVAHEGYDILKCTAFKGNDMMTNEEWIKSANTEQLAKWMQYVICHCKHCNADNAFLCQFYEKVGFVPCVGDGLVEWLKEQHHNEVEK